jgi:hypothetical protein
MGYHRPVSQWNIGKKQDLLTAYFTEEKARSMKKCIFAESNLYYSSIPQKPAYSPQKNTFLKTSPKPPIGIF